MESVKCERCGTMIDCTNRKTDNKGNIILLDVCIITPNNKKEIVCKTCFNKYKNERN